MHIYLEWHLVCMYICGVNQIIKIKFNNMKKANTLRKVTISLRWYFRDFFSIENGYSVLPSNF